MRFSPSSSKFYGFPIRDINYAKVHVRNYWTPKFATLPSSTCTFGNLLSKTSIGFKKLLKESGIHQHNKSE